MDLIVDTSELDTLPNDLDGIERGLTKLQREITLAIWSAVTIGTPVDTGRARAGWIATVGKPSEFITPAGKHQGAAQPELSNLRPGDTSYIVNNVHYIVYLNEGHSQQAPAKFVERAIRNVLAAYKS